MIVRVLCLIAATLSFGVAARAQSRIELRTAARIAPGAPITLGQVARLEGPDAQALKDIALAPATPGSIRVEEVQKALDESGKVNWGRITLRGGLCQLLDPLPESTPAPAPPSSSADPAPAAPDTLRAAVESRLAQILGVAPADLRVTFGAEDAEALNLSTAGRTVQVRPTAMADRIPLRITVYEGDRVVGPERTIRVAVRVRRDVLIASTPRSRGEVFGPGDYSIDSQWLPPTSRPATPGQVAGAACKSRLTPGQVIETDDVAPAVVVNKGEVVSIRCIAGGVIVATRARALSPARDGEILEFQAMDTKRRFFARMDGRGRAILAAAPGPDETPARDTPAVPDSFPFQGDRIAPPLAPEAAR